METMKVRKSLESQVSDPFNPRVQINEKISQSSTFNGSEI